MNENNMVQRRCAQFAVTLVLCCGTQTVAQPGPDQSAPPGRGPRVSKMLLLQIPEVRKELHLSDEQLKAIQELNDAANDSRGAGGGPPGAGARLQPERPANNPRRRDDRPPRDDGPTERTEDPHADDPPPNGPPAGGPPNDGPRRRANRPNDPGRQPPPPGDNRAFGMGPRQTRRDDRRLAEILDEKQLERLGQIMLQTIGSRALRDPQIAEQLGIDEEQAKEIADAQQSAQYEMRQRMRQLRDASDSDFDNQREKLMELRKELERGVIDELTEEQRAKFEGMQGEPFELPSDVLFRLQVRRPGVGGGPPGRNAGPPKRADLED